jgi:hypothetical protein
MDTRRCGLAALLALAGCAATDLGTDGSMPRAGRRGLELELRERGTAAGSSAPHTNVGLAVKVGALGAGLDVALPLARRVNVRVGFSAMALEQRYQNDGIDLTANLTMRSFSTYLDWFPFGGGFHLSPGVMVYNGNRISAVASEPGGGTFTLDDRELMSDPSDPVRGTAVIEFERVAPALVIGWGNILPRGGRRWSVPFEIGVVYARPPTLALALHGSACDADGSSCRDLDREPLLRAAMAREEATWNADLAPLKILPVVSLGFGYKF